MQPLGDTYRHSRCLYFDLTGFLAKGELNLQLIFKLIIILTQIAQVSEKSGCNVNVELHISENTYLHLGNGLGAVRIVEQGGGKCRSQRGGQKGHSIHCRTTTNEK